MFKKLFSLVLCVLMLTCTAFLGLAEGDAYVMAGYDSKDTYRDWTTNLFFSRMEALTGVQFNYRQYTTAAEWQKAKSAMETGADLPDVLFKAALSDAECMDLWEKGVLIDLAPLLEENCPNLWAILQANPDIVSEITLPGGAIVALPYITFTPMQNCMWVNTVWLKNVGLSMPTDAESFTSMLRAFKEKDPNQNGKKDEIPLTFLGAFDLKFLAHAYGMICNDYNIYEKNGTVCFMPLDENFRPFIEWCRSLYAEGLIDRDGFTTSDTLRQVTDENSTVTYGVIMSAMISNVYPSAWTKNYAVIEPLAYNGEKVYRDFSTNCLAGTFAITSKCDDPAKMLQWVDYLYSVDGAKLATVGEENTDYVVDGDGTWRITASVSNNAYFTAESTVSSGTTAPGLSSDDFQRLYSDTTIKYISEQLDIVNRYAKRPFPSYALTSAQENEITALQNKIGRAVDTQFARWVLGEDEITDASFEAFEKELNALGLDQFLAFWQNVLDTQK